MKITCIAHSGILIELDSCNLIFDYYKDPKRIINSGMFRKKSYVFVSHEHSDHYNKDIFNWRQHGNVHFIIEKGCKVPSDVEASRICEGDALNFPEESMLITAFGSTDLGVSFLVEIHGLTLFHAGDLNCWYWEDESTQEELAEDEGRYLKIIETLPKNKIDIAFIPEDPRLGVHAGRGISQFRSIVQPKRIVPMHFPGNEGIVY